MLIIKIIGAKNGQGYEIHIEAYQLIEKIQRNTDMSGEYWVYDIKANLQNHGF